MNPRIVLHIDMDCFFAAVEERENPHFKGKPVVVCTSTPLSVHPSQEIEIVPEKLEDDQFANHPERVKRVEGWGADPKQGKGRGVVSTANYEARKYGIHSAMPISQAWKLCPKAVFLPVNGELYKRVSENIMEIIRRAFSGCPLEQVSLDEAYINASQIGRPSKIGSMAKKLKHEIYRQERLSCSIGIGPNKMVAKMACEKAKPGSETLTVPQSGTLSSAARSKFCYPAKPNGVLAVEPQEVQAFLDPLPIQDIPGVGPKTEAQIARIFSAVPPNKKHINALVHRCRRVIVRDIKWLPKEKLREVLGKHGEALYDRVRGIDESPVVVEEEVKSVGKEHTFEADTRDGEELFSVFKELFAEVVRGAEQEGFLVKTVTVVCRFQGFETHTKSKTLKEKTQDWELLGREAKRLLLRFLVENPKPVRLIGVRLKVVPAL